MNPPASSGLPQARCLVIIGASTGGTRAVTEIIQSLPRLPASILIVQHMPKYINASLVRSLSQCAAAPVRLVQDGDSLEEGKIFLAPSEVHCRIVNNRTCCLTPGGRVNYVCPSIDVTMTSLRPPVSGQRLIGVILTGMGKDGAAGLAHMKRLGSLTIAQNEATCAVYGMPAEAVRLGCVDRVLPPKQIALELVRGTAS